MRVVRVPGPFDLPAAARQHRRAGVDRGSALDPGADQRPQELPPELEGFLGSVDVAAMTIATRSRSLAFMKASWG